MSSNKLYVFDMATLSVEEMTIAKESSSRIYVDRKLPYTRADGAGGNWFHAVAAGQVRFDSWEDTEGRKAVVCAYARDRAMLVEAVGIRLRDDRVDAERAAGAAATLLAKFNKIYGARADA